MAAQNPANNPMIDTWALVRNLFSREEYHLQQIARLEKALSNAGVKNHNERTAYNSLQLQYDRLNHAYTLLYDQHEHLKQELAALRSQYSKLEQSPSFDGARVEELA